MAIKPKSKEFISDSESDAESDDGYVYIYNRYILSVITLAPLIENITIIKIANEKLMIFILFFLNIEFTTLLQDINQSRT